jgi:hypothetical protein
MSRDFRYAAATECTNADLARQAVDLLTATRTRPLLRAFALGGDDMLATALRIDGKLRVFQMRVRECDPAQLDNLLEMHGQQKH